MIVDPDFFDHWKTILLTDELGGDQAAPVYVLRLWAHCQNRRQWVFDSLSEKALKALCRFPGHANKLLAGLVASGFIRIEEGDEITVVGWDEYNAQLIANWSNGKLGGRPRKKAKTAHGKPMGNPRETHPEPIGEDRKGLDKHTPTPTAGEPEKPSKRKADRRDALPDPHPRWADQWAIWVESWQGREQRKFDPIKASMQLGQLLGTDPEKAERDLTMSIQKYAKSILDSDVDFAKLNNRSNSVTNTKKCELDI